MCTGTPRRSSAFGKEPYRVSDAPMGGSGFSSIAVTSGSHGCACGVCVHGQHPCPRLGMERWEKCRVGGIVLSRITPDGRIWVTYTADHVGALREWQECDRKAAAEQGRRRAAPSQPSPSQVTTSGAAPAQGPIQAPVWKIGHEWAYRGTRVLAAQGPLFGPWIVSKPTKDSRIM